MPVINPPILLYTVYVNLYVGRLALCVYDVVVMFCSFHCNIYCLYVYVFSRTLAMFV